MRRSWWLSVKEGFFKGISSRINFNPAKDRIFHMNVKKGGELAYWVLGGFDLMENFLQTVVIGGSNKIRFWMVEKIWGSWRRIALSRIFNLFLLHVFLDFFSFNFQKTFWFYIQIEIEIEIEMSYFSYWKHFVVPTRQ